MPEQLSLIERTKSKRPPRESAADLPNGRYKLYHLKCGTYVGSVVSLAYHLRDVRAGFTGPDGLAPDHRKRIYCPWKHCNAQLTQIGELQALRETQEERAE